MSFVGVKRHFNLRTNLLVGTGLLLVVSSTLLSLHQTHQLAAEKATAQATAAQKLAHDKTSKAAKLAAGQANQSTVTSGTPASTTTSSPATPKAASTSAPAIKYSTSSDPRSTAYSLTPPKPNPASFNIAITHAGQVSAGTVISNNATKGEREIYGGDLKLSDTTIYVTDQERTFITVSSPDGAIMGMPSEPYDDISHKIATGMDGSEYIASGTSFHILFQAVGAIANGTYHVHLMSSRTAQTADGYEYDGFVTVIYRNTNYAPVM